MATPIVRFILVGILLALDGVLGSGADAQQCKGGGRVVGGTPTDIKQHPWQVALDINGRLCGGSIIAHDWVLTAAHCIDSEFNKDQIRLKAGVTRYNQAVGVPVERVVLHENYDRVTYEHDLALLKVRMPPTGRVIPLARTDQVLNACELLEVSGWGRTKEGGVTSNELMKASVPFIDQTVCNDPEAYGGAVRENMLCAGYDEGGIDSCEGDSGGPLVLRGRDGPLLIGVVSWGIGCARRSRYGVYTRVSAYREWIASIIAGTSKAEER